MSALENVVANCDHLAELCFFKAAGRMLAQEAWQ